jgi:muramoyltetrapeptide carboxypeptidase
MSSDVADRVQALAGTLYPDRTPEIFFHPQCFASHGHFAGDDDTRAQAFIDIANDESYDAVWFARGGYGSCRVAESVMRRLTEASRRKTYVGYSDAGMLRWPGWSIVRPRRWSRQSALRGRPRRST